VKLSDQEYKVQQKNKLASSLNELISCSDREDNLYKITKSYAIH